MIANTSTVSFHKAFRRSHTEVPAKIKKEVKNLRNHVIALIFATD